MRRPIATKTSIPRGRGDNKVFGENAGEFEQTIRLSRTILRDPQTKQKPRQCRGFSFQNQTRLYLACFFPFLLTERMMKMIASTTMAISNSGTAA